MSNKPSDETFIIPPQTMPGQRTAGPYTDSAATVIMPGQGSPGQQTPQSGKFVDPFETVLMPTARRVAEASASRTPGSHQDYPAMSETQVIRPDMQAARPAPAAEAGSLNGVNPIVALVIVVDGPGKGSFRPLYYGNNSIGRDPSQRVPLNFGDDTISGHEQAFIRYDHEDRKFLFIPNLSKTNVVALNSEKPTTAVPLQAWDEIRMGQTRLRFIPVCGPEFDWADTLAK